MRMQWMAAVGAAAVVCALAPPAAVAVPAQARDGSLFVAWETGEQQERIAVSWEAVPQVTRVVLEKADGTTEREYDASNADQGLTVDPADVPTGGVWRFASYSGSELIARTAPFDSDRAVPATITKIAVVPGALGIAFRLGRTTDTTPGDPLDTVSVAAEQKTWCDFQTKNVRYRLPSGQPETDHAIGYSDYSAPGALRLATSSGFGSPVYTEGWLNRITIYQPTLPRTGTWSQPLTFTASPTEFRHPGCEFSEEPVAVDRVRLQTRKGASDEWRTVTPTSAVMVNGTLTVRTPAIGNSEYRFYAPERSPAPDELELGHQTAAIPLTVSTRLLSAKFSDATVTTTQRTTASIWVGPYGTQLATLQYRRSPTAAWAAVVNRKLVSGRVSYTFAWNRKGVTYFRWVVAPTTYAGLRVEGKVTGTMVLTVR